MGKGWYVIQTYSGYEQKIERTLNKFRERDPELGACISGICVPFEKVTTRDENGMLKVEDRKILPGYLLIEMELPEKGWNPIISKIVGITGVSGFLTGDPNGKNPPKPLSEVEHKKILVRMGTIPEEKTYKPRKEFSEGEEVLITDGPFASIRGVIEEVDNQKNRLMVSVQVFGRSTPVEVGFDEAEKVTQ